MARTFNGTTDFMRVASALGVTAPPFTFCAWFKNVNNTATGTVMSLSDGASDAHYIIYRGATVNDPVGAASNDQGAASGESQAITSGAISWHVLMGWFGATNNREVHRGRLQAYVSGTAQTTDVTPDSMSEWNIGRYSSTVGSYLAADIARAAIWSVALTTGELKSLAMGFSPRRVRPQSLAFYAPLVRDVFDWRTGATISVTGAATVAPEDRSYGL